MAEAFVCAYVRTPIGRFGGALSSVRADDLGAVPLKALMARHAALDFAAVDEVIFGCANQAGEDNRNVARMAALLAGLPASVSALTLNRLCGSGMDAVITAARAIRAGEAELVIAGGVESMSRAPFVMPKAAEAFSRNAEIYDTTIGWRFVNPLMKAQYGVDSMPDTAENVAADYKVSRADQDAFAIRSQQRAGAAQASGRLSREITPVAIAQRKGDPVSVDRDEHPRADTRLESLARLPTPFRKDGTVTAASSSSISDGAAATILLSEDEAKKRGIKPLARIVGHATLAQEPAWFTTAPVGAIEQLLKKIGWNVDDVDLFEVNEAFAVVAMAPMRDLGIAHEKLNVNGGACALGHPIGASGARLVVTLIHALKARGGKRGVAALCIGGGEATALAIELL